MVDDKKISQLTIKTTVDDADVVAIFDVNGAATKGVTRADFIGSADLTMEAGFDLIMEGASADEGFIRMKHLFDIAWRNAANDGNVTLDVGTDSAGADTMRVINGNFEIQSANRMYVDGGFDSYFGADGSNVISFHLGVHGASVPNKVFTIGEFFGAKIEEETSFSATPSPALQIKSRTSADMADGFATRLQFAIEDTAAVEEIIACIDAARSAGDDDAGTLNFKTATTAGTLTQALEIDETQDVLLSQELHLLEDKKIYMDGTTNSFENAGNLFRWIVNGNIMMDLGTSLRIYESGVGEALRLTIFGSNVDYRAFGSRQCRFMTEDTGGTIRSRMTLAGNLDSMRLTLSGVDVSGICNLRCDSGAGTDTLIQLREASVTQGSFAWDASANMFVLSAPLTGAAVRLSTLDNFVEIHSDAYIVATGKFYWDSGGDTWTDEVSADVLNFHIGAFDSIRMGTSGVATGFPTNGVINLQDNQSISWRNAADTNQNYIRFDTDLFKMFINSVLEYQMTATAMTLFGNNIAQANDVEIDGDLNHDGSGVGFFGIAPTTQPTAYTQTFATADKTHAARTAVSMGDLVATEGTGWGASSEANFDKITTAVDQLIADQVDTAAVVNALIDDLQALGLAL